MEVFSVIANKKAFRCHRDVYATGPCDPILVYGDCIVLVLREHAPILRKSSPLQCTWIVDNPGESAMDTLTLGVDDISVKTDFPSVGDVCFFVSVKAVVMTRRIFLRILSPSNPILCFHSPFLCRLPYSAVSRVFVLRSAVFEVDLGFEEDTQTVSRPYPEYAVVTVDCPLRALQYACMHQARVHDQAVKKRNGEKFDIGVLHQECFILSEASAKRLTGNDVFPRVSAFQDVSSHACLESRDVDAFISLCYPSLL